MSEFIERFVKAALREMGLHYLVSEEHPDLVIVPIPLPGNCAAYLHLHIHADDDLEEVVVSILLREIPPACREAAAFLVAQRSLKHKGVAFGLDEDGDAIAIAFIELAHASDRAALVELFLKRILHAVTAELDAIEQAARPKGKQATPRVLREAKAIVRKHDR